MDRIYIEEPTQAKGTITFGPFYYADSRDWSTCLTNWSMYRFVEQSQLEIHKSNFLAKIFLNHHTSLPGRVSTGRKL